MIVFDAANGLYRLESTDTEHFAKARNTGFDFSLGSNRYYTDSPYMALYVGLDTGLHGSAADKLAPLKRVYDMSIDTAGATECAVPGNKSLMPFQRAGVSYALQAGSCLIGDQPGLGKTCQAIVVANEMMAQRVCIVCPASVRRHWAKEIQAWSMMAGGRIYITESAEDWIDARANWSILSFEGVTNEHIFKALVKRGRFDLLIVDESHYLKTPTSKRTQACFGGGLGVWADGGLADYSERVLCLSGTPTPNRPREAYTTMNAVCPDSLVGVEAFSQFQERYNPSLFRGEAVGREAELQMRMRCHMMVRRLKDEVFKDRPPVSLSLTYLSENADIKKALKAERMLHIDPSHLTPEDVAGGEISTVRRMMGEAKVPMMIKYLKTLLDGGEEKIMFVGWHKSVLRPMAEEFGRRAVLIDGTCTGLMKEQRKDRFIQDPEVNIIFGQMISIGTGVDGLQHVCNRVIIGEPDWVPGQNQQTFDRLDRFGQTRPVLGEFLVVEGSFDELVLQKVFGKSRVIHGTLDSALGEIA